MLKKLLTLLTVFVGTEDDPVPRRRYEAAVESADPRLALSSGRATAYWLEGAVSGSGRRCQGRGSRASRAPGVRPRWSRADVAA